MTQRNATTSHLYQSFCSIAIYDSVLAPKESRRVPPQAPVSENTVPNQVDTLWIPPLTAIRAIPTRDRILVIIMGRSCLPLNRYALPGALDQNYLVLGISSVNRETAFGHPHSASAASDAWRWSGFGSLRSHDVFPRASNSPCQEGCRIEIQSAACRHLSSWPEFPIPTLPYRKPDAGCSVNSTADRKGLLGAASRLAGEKLSGAANPESCRLVTSVIASS